MRAVEELTATSEPAWPGLEADLRSGAGITILPVEAGVGRESLYRLQVTTRSTMGALALHTGGLLVDDGWLRVLGGGSGESHGTGEDGESGQADESGDGSGGGSGRGDGGESGRGGLPSLAEANGLPGNGEAPPSLLVGYDVLGGRFELNGPDPAVLKRPGGPGELCYFAPDTLEWEALEVGHGAWLAWIADGGTAEFYRSLRWPGWRDEVRALPLSHGLTVFPFLWSQEAQEDLAATTRGPAPMAELFALQNEFAARFA